jgi:ectoine hydroxylase-related dioxygenase (phytanoyl-CoA dioxygenase family)
MLARLRARSAADEFWRQGFVVLRKVFAPREIACLRAAITANGAMTDCSERARGKFANGKYPSFETIFVWNDTSGEDIFAKFTRAARLWTPLTQIFADEVYVYHNKVALKYPGIPGFRFHQDYFYWYGMGCLYPDLATCYIAVDPATRANGCLKLVEGSHRLGRVEHTLYDGVADSGVDEERLAAILQRLAVSYIELEPGDCVIFHCNTLHGSDANLSDHPRLALLGCYNTRHNDPYVRHHEHPNFIRQEPITAPVTEADVGVLPDFALSYGAS